MQCNFRDGIFTLRGQPEGPCKPSCWRHLNLLRLKCFITLTLPMSFTSERMRIIIPGASLWQTCTLRRKNSESLLRAEMVWPGLRETEWRPCQLAAFTELAAGDGGRGSMCGHGRIGASGSPARMNEELIADCSSLLIDVHLFRLKHSVKSTVSK